ncbi:MAG: flagellar biosynthetic protein FliR [Elusimicrobia bacterium]|nr:flagellar biosynthetic protein FliR [Elusimicrobiota bacterium]
MAIPDPLRFVLVFARVLGLFAVAPPFAGRGVPVARLAAALGVSALVVSWARGAPPLATDAWGVGLAVISETGVGAALGGLLALFFSAYQTAGHLIGNQMGFGWAGFFDPRTNESVDDLAELYHRLALLLFFILDGPWRLLKLTVWSFEKIGPGEALWTGRLAGLWVESVGRSMALAAAAAAPTVGALWLSSLLIGFLVRAAPQMNLAAIDFPARALIGFASLWVGVAALIRFFPGTAAGAFDQLSWFLKNLGG